MHHHINRLLSSDDVLMVIANSGGNPNLSSAKKRVTYATNEVGTTGGRPPVNWCGHHMRHAAIRSTPTLTPSTLYNADWNSPRGNICGTSPNCMKMCMRGQNPSIQPTYGDQNSPMLFNPSNGDVCYQCMPVNGVRKKIIKTTRNANQCCAVKPKRSSFNCSTRKIATKRTGERLGKIGKQRSSSDMPEAFQVYFNKMMLKYKKFCCKQGALHQVEKCIHSPIIRQTRFHRACDDGFKPIPSHMGWDWNVIRKETGAGWRPGAIPKSIRTLMYHFLDPFPCDTNPVSKPARKLPDPKSLPTTPIIQLCRHNDAYTVTLNDDNKLKPPVSFSISASVEQQELAKVKQVLICKGFRYCNCGRSLALCECRDQCELNELYALVKQIEKQFKIKDVIHRLCFEKSKDLYLEFTPANIANSMVHEGPNERLEVVRRTGDTDQKRNVQNNIEKFGKKADLSTISKPKNNLKNLPSSNIGQPQDTFTSPRSNNPKDSSLYSRQTKDRSTPSSYSNQNKSKSKSDSQRNLQESDSQPKSVDGDDDINTIYNLSSMSNDERSCKVDPNSSSYRRGSTNEPNLDAEQFQQKTDRPASSSFASSRRSSVPKKNGIFCCLSPNHSSHRRESTKKHHVSSRTRRRSKRTSSTSARRIQHRSGQPASTSYSSFRTSSEPKNDPNLRSVLKQSSRSTVSSSAEQLQQKTEQPGNTSLASSRTTYEPILSSSALKPSSRSTTHSSTVQFQRTIDRPVRRSLASNRSSKSTKKRFCCGF